MSDLVATTHFRNLNDTGVNVTNGIARVSKIVITNTVTATTVFVQLFDTAAASVTLGTTRPAITVHVSGAAATVGGTVTLDFEGDPWSIQTRLSAFATTTAEGNTGAAAGVFLSAFVN